MSIKFKYKGEDVEIEETEVIKAVKEEYDKKQQEYEKKIADIEKENAEKITSMREEHAKQLRVIMTTGKIDDKTEEEIKKEEEQNSIDEAIKRIVKKFQ